MRLTINLATRTYLNNRQLNYLFAFIFILLIFLLMINIRHIASSTAETSRIKEDLKAFQHKSGSSGKRIPESEYQDLVNQIKSANEIIYRKTFSWLTLLDKLEGVIPEGVSIKQIEPDSKNKILKLSGTTPAFSKLRLMLENMEASRDFAEIYLLTQSVTRVGDSQKGISFSITCQVKM